MNMKKIISTILSLTMLLTATGAVSAFAVEKNDETEKAAITEVSVSDASDKGDAVAQKENIDKTNEKTPVDSTDSKTTSSEVLTVNEKAEKTNYFNKLGRGIKLTWNFAAHHIKAIIGLWLLGYVATMLIYGVGWIIISIRLSSFGVNIEQFMELFNNMCAKECINKNLESNILETVINVSPNASCEEIQKAYRSAAQSLHPDKIQNENLKLYLDRIFVRLNSEYVQAKKVCTR